MHAIPTVEMHGLFSGLAFLAGMVACSRAAGSESLESGPAAETDVATRDEIRVITYNVQFLPWPARGRNLRPDAPYRALRIGREMAAFDIVGLQETFDRGPRRRLLRELERGWGGDFHAVIHPRPRGVRFLYSGGLAIASRFPILESHVLHYSAYSRPRDHGFHADGWAAKGALHARLQRSPGEPESAIDVFVTHLEARDPSLRLEQVRELTGFMTQHGSPERPMLLLGDLNINGTPGARAQAGAPYHRMMEILREVRPEMSFMDLWPTLRGEAQGGTTEQDSVERGGRIDYLLLSTPPQAPEDLRPLDITIHPFLDERVGALSDHNAVSARLAWPSRPTTVPRAKPGK